MENFLAKNRTIRIRSMFCPCQSKPRVAGTSLKNSFLTPGTSCFQVNKSTYLEDIKTRKSIRYMKYYLPKRNLLIKCSYLFSPPMLRNECMAALQNIFFCAIEEKYNRREEVSVGVLYQSSHNFKKNGTCYRVITGT